MPRLVKGSLSCASTQLLTRAAKCQAHSMLFLLVSGRDLFARRSAVGHWLPAPVHASAPRA